MNETERFPASFHPLRTLRVLRGFDFKMSVKNKILRVCRATWAERQMVSSDLVVDNLCADPFSTRGLCQADGESALGFLPAAQKLHAVIGNDLANMNGLRPSPGGAVRRAHDPVAATHTCPLQIRRRPGPHAVPIDPTNKWYYNHIRAGNASPFYRSHEKIVPEYNSQTPAVY